MPDRPEKTQAATAEDLSAGVSLSPAERHKIELRPPLGILAGHLYDQHLVDTLAEYAYEIWDGEKQLYAGKTDEHGFFMHEDVPADYYILKANNEEHLVPTIQPEDEPVAIAVLGEEGAASEADEVS